MLVIKIKEVKESDAVILAQLGRLTWEESHGQYIEDKDELLRYLTENFSVAKTKQNLDNPNNLFYFIHVHDVLAGYAKLILKATNESVASENTCRLERIFILKDFIPLKIGKQLLHFVEQKAKELNQDNMWLTVYIKNKRAIRFYEKNEFENVGALNFVVSGKEYENIVFSKKL